MPQKIYLIESEDEVIARNAGMSIGQDLGYSKGFQIASILWIFVMIVTLFITLDNNYEINMLKNLRVKVSTQLKAQIPQYNELIDKVIPDGNIENKLAALRAKQNMQ